MGWREGWIRSGFGLRPFGSSRSRHGAKHLGCEEICGKGGGEAFCGCDARGRVGSLGCGGGCGSSRFIRASVGGSEGFRGFMDPFRLSMESPTGGRKTGGRSAGGNGESSSDRGFWGSGGGVVEKWGKF